MGTLDVAVPKLREGSFFPDWLLTRQRRSEAALTTVVATCYLIGVSTRRMDKLVRTLGITGLSKSQVSEMAKDLDEQVEQFRTRPLNEGPYTFIAADALTMKVREGGRVVNECGLVFTTRLGDPVDPRNFHRGLQAQGREGRRSSSPDPLNSADLRQPSRCSRRPPTRRDGGPSPQPHSPDDGDLLPSVVGFNPRCTQASRGRAIWVRTCQGVLAPSRTLAPPRTLSNH